jgi:hypothetical protein
MRTRAERGAAGHGGRARSSLERWGDGEDGRRVMWPSSRHDGGLPHVWRP